MCKGHTSTAVLPSHPIAVPDGDSCDGRPLPLAAMVHRAMTNPIRLWTREHFHKLVVMHDSVFGRRMVVSDPAIIRHVLAGDPANFPRDALQQRIIARVTGNSVFSAMGESWKLQRSLLGGQFVPTRIKAYEAAFEQIASAACQRLAAARGEAIDLFAFMGAVAVSAINQALLSGRLRCWRQCKTLCSRRPLSQAKP